MNYHNITTDDMLNGDGLRVVLWCSGCRLNCYKCQNPQTHDFKSGIPFDEETMQEIIDALDKPYISGVTLSGGHPIEPENFDTILNISRVIDGRFPDKDIWLYSGYTWEYIVQDEKLKTILPYIDVLVDGTYIDELRDITLPWRGSSNQRVIDVNATLNSSTPDIPILYCG